MLPVYNGGRFLAGALEALRAQTLTDWELIAVDDGSTDDSLARLEAAARDDARVRVIRHAANRGIGAAFVSGLLAAGAKHVYAAARTPQTLAALAQSAGADIVARVLQTRDFPEAATLIGAGKVA